MTLNGRGLDLNRDFVVRAVSKISREFMGHRLSRSATYKSWGMMKVRCLNPNYSRYADYGGRGIKICKRWMQFSNFLSDMGIRPDGTTLDRINVNAGYMPSNCRWATRKTQQNNMTTTFKVRFKGKMLPIHEVAEILGKKAHTLYVRIRRGWSTQDALNRPIRRRIHHVNV